MCVCIYQLNIFLWYISIAGKYLKWKNHIYPFILNKIIIGSPHILFSQSLNISISFFHLFFFFNINSSRYIINFFLMLHFDILLSCDAFFWCQFIVCCFISLYHPSTSLMIDHWTFCFNWCVFVCSYQWNIFLWYISIVCKYLKWKNHIYPFILNEMIIGFPHILSSQSLNIWISSFYVLYLFDLNLLYIVSYPYISFPLLWWSIIGFIVSFNVHLFVFIDGIYFYDIFP